MSAPIFSEFMLEEITKDSVTQQQAQTDAPELNGAVFIDKELVLYDKYYEPVKSQADDSTYTLLDKIFFNENLSIKDFSFPSIELENNKKNYGVSMSSWKLQLEKITNGIILPNIIVSKTFIPSFPSIIEPNTPIYRKFDPAKNPLQPKNLVSLISKITTDKKIDLNENFPQQLPKRDTLQFKHHVAVDKQWQSQLIPAEPNYLLYKTFEEYERAYQNWEEITRKQFEIPQYPKVGDFRHIIKVDFAKSQQTEDFRPAKQENENNDDRYAWVKKVDFSPGFDFQLEKLFEPIEKEPEQKNDYIVFGVNKEEFINDMIQYGVHKESLDASSPVHVFKYLENRVQDVDLTNVEQELHENPLKIFKYDGDLDTMLQSIQQTSGWVLQSTIANNFNNSTLMKLIDIAENSATHFYKVSLLFKKIISNPRVAACLFNEFKNPEKIDIFYKFIRIALAHAQENVQLYYIQHLRTDLSVAIEQIHFFSLLLDTNLVQVFTELHTNIYEFCRNTLKYISSQLENQIQVIGLWNTAQTDDYGEYSYEICALLSMHSELIYHQLFKDSFSKMLEISEFKVGRYILNSIGYSNPGWFARNFITMSKDFKSRLASTINPTFSYFMSLLLDQYRVHLHRVNLPPQMDHISDILQPIIHDYSERLYPIVNVIIKIINDFIPKKKNQFFNDLCGSFISQICTLAVSKTTMSIERSFGILARCTKFPTYNSQILSNGEFVNILINGLLVGSKKSIHDAWKIFMALASTDASMDKIFKIADISSRFQRVAETEDPLVFQKFCKLIIKIYNTGGFQLLDKFLVLIDSKMGRFACTIKNSSILFGYSDTTKTMYEMLNIIYHKHGSSTFKTKMKKHLESVNFEFKKKGFLRTSSRSIISSMFPGNT